MGCISRALPALMLIQGIGAFIQCLPGSMAGPAVGKGLAAAPPGGSGRGVLRSAQAPGLRKSCRMAAVGEEEAIKNIKAWSGTPKDARLVCAPSPSDAGVIATLLREVENGSGSALLVAPNCDSAADFAAMGRMADYLNCVCPGADVEALKDAPHSCLSFKSRDVTSSKAGADKVSDEEVMGKVLDWFTSILINLADEEMYINIGRSLLGVQHYAVCHADSVKGVTEEFWSEVSSMVEGRQGGNILMVMTRFQGGSADEFGDFVEKKLAEPLEWATGSSEKLVLSRYHPESKDGLASPWPLIQISVFDPAPPRGENDFGPEDEEGYLDAEIETSRVTADDLRDAKAKNEGKKPTPMPGFPLNLDELDESK